MAAINQDFIKAFNSGLEALKVEASTPEAHWYPCGFAWLCIKIRKNGALAKTLLSLGFNWDSYHRTYMYSMPNQYIAEGMWQSMDYAARCLRAMAAKLREAGFECYVKTHID